MPSSCHIHSSCAVTAPRNPKMAVQLHVEKQEVVTYAANPNDNEANTTGHVHFVTFARCCVAYDGCYYYNPGTNYCQCLLIDQKFCYGVLWFSTRRQSIP